MKILLGDTKMNNLRQVNKLITKAAKAELASVNFSNKSVRLEEEAHSLKAAAAALLARAEGLMAKATEARHKSLDAYDTYAETIDEARLLFSEGSEEPSETKARTWEKYANTKI